MNFEIFLQLFVATLIPAAAFLAGGLASKTFSHFLAANAAPVIAFASGAMLSITFLHVLPEAVEFSGSSTWPAIFAGILFFYFLENFALIHACNSRNHDDCPNHRMGWLATLGLGIHSLFDGVIVVLAFLANPTVGVFATIGIALHRLPAGAVLHMLTLHGEQKPSFAPIWIVGLAPLAAVFLAPIFTRLPEAWIGGGLAFAAGGLMYVTLSDMLPETHRAKNKTTLMWLLVGVFLIFGISQIFSHGHSHETEAGHSHAIEHQI